MPDKAGFRRAVRNVDDVLYLSTGKRLRDILGRSINLFGDQVAKKVAGIFADDSEPEASVDSPYKILRINPDAPDFLVRASYKANMKKYHPQGETPDEERAKLINNAYDQICLEREMTK